MEGNLISAKWESPDADVVESCTILTTTADELISQLHNRMPVILQPENYDLWLDPEVQEAGIIEPLLNPTTTEDMTLFPVSPMVNRLANDNPGCIEPLR